MEVWPWTHFIIVKLIDEIRDFAVFNIIESSIETLFIVLIK